MCPARTWENSWNLKKTAPHLKRLITFSILALIVILGLYFICRPKKVFFPRLGGNAPAPEKLERIARKSEAAIAANPQDLTAAVDLGVARYHLGPDHYAKSYNALSRAWTQGAFDERIFYYLGLLNENLSNFYEAEKQYLRFLNHEPRDREIQLRLARLEFRMGNWEKSIEQYKRLADRNPKDVTSLINLGLAYQSQVKAEAADKSKNRKPDSEIQNHLDQGIAYLEKARDADPSLAKGLFLSLAQMYLEKEQWDKAQTAAQAELIQYPGENDIEAYRALALSFEKQNRKETLLDTYQKWERIDPANPGIPRKIRQLKRDLKIK